VPLGAAAPADRQGRVVGARRREKGLDQRRLADPPRPGHEGKLRPAGARLAQQLVETLQLGGAPDEGARRVAAGRRRRGGASETEAAPVDGFEKARPARVVAQGGAQLADRLGQRVGRDGDARPDGVEQLLAADEQSRPLRQMNQHRPGLRPQRNRRTAPGQLAAPQIERERGENDGVGAGLPRRRFTGILGHDGAEIAGASGAG